MSLFLTPDKITTFSYQKKTAITHFDREGLKQTEEYFVNRYFLKKKKILYLGCGTGRTSRELVKLGFRVTAIDNSPAMIEEAKKKGKIQNPTYHVMDAASLLFSDNSFDICLFSFNGLDYLYPETKRRSAIREIYRVLKPGGIFSFSSHNSLFLPNTVSRLVNLGKSVLKGKLSPYRWDFQEFGPVITHVISPNSELAELKSFGYNFLEIVSRYSKRPFFITVLDPYPTYVCQKPK